MNVVKEGDLVLIVVGEKRKFVIKVERGKILGTDIGYILHDELIGKPYGSRIETSTGLKALVLKPIRQDYYSRGFARATQVIHPKDVALVIYLSGIGPGSRVGEAGVGSGMLTLAIASIIGKSGRLYGFDTSERALECARANVEKAGFADIVVLEKRDVREELETEPLDAFFLDIPDPWNALKSVSKVLKPSGTLLIYVPTMNQVEKTVLALRESGLYADIKALEVMLRELHVERGAVRPATCMIGHTGYIVFARRLLD